MGIVVSNFSFLDAEFNDLASIAKKAELLYSVDADSCATKLRLFGELWLHELNRLSGNKVNLSGTFGELINKAFKSKLIDAYYMELLEPLRSYGNSSSHVRYSEISQKARFQTITKSQLKTNFISILTLADVLFEKAEAKGGRSKDWQEPADLIGALVYQNAFFDNLEAILELLQIKLKELSLLPDSRKRHDIKIINSKLVDCEYWLTKAYYLDAIRVSFECYLYYKGYYHMAACNAQKCGVFKNKALELDVSGDAHFFVAIELNNSQEIDSYKLNITKAISKGHFGALDHYLNLIHKTKLVDDYWYYLNVGIENNYVPCLITTAIHKIIELNNVGEESKRPLKKDINRILIQLKATESKAGLFIEAMCVSLEQNESFDTSHAKSVVDGAKLLPGYCMASSFALYTLSFNSMRTFANRNLVETAIKEAEGTDYYGPICYFAALTLAEVLTKQGIFTVAGFSTEQLISKSVSLGYEPAIDCEKDMEQSNTLRRTKKGKRSIRKQTKAKRKQGRSK